MIPIKITGAVVSTSCAQSCRSGSECCVVIDFSCAVTMDVLKVLLLCCRMAFHGWSVTVSDCAHALGWCAHALQATIPSCHVW